MKYSLCPLGSLSGFFSDFQGEFTNLFLERKKYTLQIIVLEKQRQFEMWFTAKNCILGHLRLAVLVSQALFSICFVLNQSHMGAGVTIMVSK